MLMRNRKRKRYVKGNGFKAVVMFAATLFLHFFSLQQRRTHKSGTTDDGEGADLKKSKKTGKNKKKVSGVGDIDSDGNDSKKKPRIKIKVKAVKGSKKATKRKRGAESEDDQTVSDEKTASDAESMRRLSKRHKKNDGKASVIQKSASAAKDNDSSEDDLPLREVAAKSKRKFVAETKQSEPGSVFLDLDFWTSARESLDGSFKAARKNLLQLGPWKLPPGIPAEKFSEVAYITLDKMHKYVSKFVFSS